MTHTDEYLREQLAYLLVQRMFVRLKLLFDCFRDELGEFIFILVKNFGILLPNVSPQEIAKFIYIF